MEGRSVDEYGAPLFIAWQLTNRCGARCITCCEESGPGSAWPDELGRDEALDLARHIVAAGIPYAAFGGGEPLGVAHCWELFELLTAGGVTLKLETDGSRIDDAAADRLAGLAVQCVQISVDGATAATHARVRPGSSFAAATSAITRLVARGQPPQFVFVPNRFNVHEIVAAYDLAVDLGCTVFVTGPMMRIGRAAAAWEQIACSDEDWQRAADALRERAATSGAPIALSIYPWDIVTEMETRVGQPAGHAAGRAEWQGEAPERPSLRAGRPAPRFDRAGVGCLSQRLAHHRGARIRGPVPHRTTAARARERNVADAPAFPGAVIRTVGNRSGRSANPPARLWLRWVAGGCRSRTA